jgi:hypothetical protein
MYPKIKFLINPNKDIFNAYSFLTEDGHYRKCFFPLELQHIFKKNVSTLEQKKRIKEYTEDIYEVKRKEIEAGAKFVEEEWKEKEKAFYNFSNQIFKNHPWPKGKYIGYVSIYRLYPRYLEEKIFFFPYSTKDVSPIQVIAHEMLHFIFYDFIEKKYSKKKLNDSKYIWKISEAFNTVIETWEPYKKEMGIVYNVQPYAECEDMFLKMQKQWSEEPNLEIFLDKWLGI